MLGTPWIPTGTGIYAGKVNDVRDCLLTVELDEDGSDIWQRIRLIPFELSFVPDPKEPHERWVDLRLNEKLLREAPGILARIVRGALKYQAEGLPTPTTVTAAGEEYRAEEDTVGQFIEACCLLYPGATVRAGLLYQRYVSHCRSCNVQPIANNSFGQQLSRKGYTRFQKRNWFWVGLALDESP